MPPSARPSTSCSWKSGAQEGCPVNGETVSSSPSTKARDLAANAAAIATLTDWDFADDAVLFAYCSVNWSSPFSYSTRHPGQWDCTRLGLNQRFKMSARGYLPPQLPSTVTTSTPRKGSLTSKAMWTHVAVLLQISAAVSAWQHLQWGDSTGCGAIGDSVYHPSF